MYEDVILRSIQSKLHQHLDSVALDACCARAGCDSGIGRLSLVDDAIMGNLVASLAIDDTSSVLDLGCGQGFAARWLRARGVACAYVGVDYSTEALRAARAMVEGITFEVGDFRTWRTHRKFDVILALDTQLNGVVSEDLAVTIRSGLAEGGRFGVTLAVLDGHRYASNIEASIERCQAFSTLFVADDVTDEVRPFAQRLYRTWLEIDSWHDAIKPRMYAEANAVLKAIDEGRFRYMIVTGRI